MAHLTSAFLGHAETTTKRHYVSRHFDELFEITDRVEATEVNGIHCARHTFATVLLDRGFLLAFLRDILGHANIQTTSRYLHTSLDDGVEIGSAFDFKT